MNWGLAVFYFFAALATVGGVMTITRKNAVHSAVYLVLTFVAIAAIYVLLGADFLFAVQVLVYAGGILVLFLFVIMLVNLEEPRRFSGGRMRLAASGAMTLLLFGILATTFARSTSVTAVAASPAAEGNLQAVGAMLYTQYILPFEVVSVLLLVAMIGAIVLGRPRA
ncbi:MAG TPA: NADH-quinone oxidoreductase subunit J [Candidatus Polarisedimenticolia bacterium]|nr:NADH-quinone oxidoreductase subunit J [Candidatus Polarisedimenticolia bacterium]